MKKLLTVLAIVIASLTLTFNLASCEGRQKFDFTNVNSIADLNGAVIGAQTGTFHLDALRDQTTGVTVKEYGDFTQLLTALNSGVIDGYVAEEPTAYAVIAQDSNLTYLHLVNNDTGFTATPSDTGIAVAFATGSEYVARVNDILAGISDETRAALMQQAVTMSADPDTELNAPILVSDNEVLPEAATLKIAMECAYAPFNWSQTTAANGAVKISNTGNSFYANGYDVQIAKYIAAELGMNLEIYAEEWESLITGVQAGTYTGIIAGMSPTAEREEEVDFTDCYYNSNLVIIYKK
ncbi:MAG: transporter substrate-binding domain-containing protein [Clostridia bacterium]|nr:transporter substrate-binding domain-containing protein [Clostridia bacterium]